MPSSARRWSMLIAAPKHSGPPESTLAADAEAGEALADGHQLDRIDVEVRRQVGEPPEQIGEVLRSHRVHAFVELVRCLFVAACADDGELGLGHPRLDRGYANAGPREVAPEVERELADEGLGARVDRAALVRIRRRDRGKIDDLAPALDEPGQ